jgi:hypothetical protein
MVDAVKNGKDNISGKAKRLVSIFHNNFSSAIWTYI